MMADKAAGLIGSERVNVVKLLLCLVIGDEILKGHVKDTNSHYLAKELWSLGVNVAKVGNPFVSIMYFLLLKDICNS